MIPGDVPQHPLKRAACAGEPRPNRADGHVECLRNLTVLEPLDIGQHHDDAVVLGQGGQGPIQILAQEFVDELLFGVREPQQEGLVQRRKSRRRPRLVAFPPGAFPVGPVSSLADECCSELEYPRPKGTSGLPATHAHATRAMDSPPVPHRHRFSSAAGHAVQRTEDRQNPFKDVRVGHSAPAPRRGRGVFQWHALATVPGSLLDSRHSSALNHFAGRGVLGGESETAAPQPGGGPPSRTLWMRRIRNQEDS